MRLELKIYDISHQYKSINQSIKNSALGFSIFIQVSCQFVMSIQRSLTRVTQPRNLCGIARAIYHSTCMYGRRDIGGGKRKKKERNNNNNNDDDDDNDEKRKKR